VPVEVTVGLPRDGGDDIATELDWVDVIVSSGVDIVSVPRAGRELATLVERVPTETATFVARVTSETTSPPRLAPKEGTEIENFCR
jgi:hypothetical protein